MTNTKFRKRALLSSVAMLLVALVALGSATFAWFTENPTVKAEGIVAYGQTSTGLEISTDTDVTWSDDADFMKSGTDLKLVPAYALQGGAGTEESPYAINWLSATAADAEHSAPTGDWGDASGSIHTASASQTTIGAKIYHERAYIRTKNGEDATVALTGLSISEKSGAPTIKSGVTVLVAVNNEIKKVVKLGTTATLNYASAANGQPVGSASGEYAVVTGGTFSGSQTLGTAGTGATGHPTLTVDLYVYLDGTDSNVYTNNVSANQLIEKITANFAKA